MNNPIDLASRQFLMVLMDVANLALVGEVEDCAICLTGVGVECLWNSVGVLIGDMEGKRCLGTQDSVLIVMFFHGQQSNK